MRLNDYVTLGRSGLRVSPVGLGTMTFGAEVEDKEAQAIFQHYIDAGGNFLDTADVYSDGRSEELVGNFIQERRLRDRVVLGSKFSGYTEEHNPNAGGNGRKNCYRGLEASLRRLKTDYLDLYWLHSWDTITPAEEVVSTFDDMVRQGKIRYFGLSNTPAWYVARAQTLAEKGAKEPITAIQLEYSLLDRTVEREHIPASQQLGIGVCAWSPLAGGFLSGKYRQNRTAVQGRLDEAHRPSFPLSFKWFTEPNGRLLDVVIDIAAELRRSPAQVALNWVITQPGITSVLIGVTGLAQLKEDLGSLQGEIPAELRGRLDQISSLEIANPYALFGTPLRTVFGGKVSIEPWTPARCSGGPSQVVNGERSGKKAGSI